MSKENKTKNTYTAKQVFVALLPYLVILIMATTFAGVVLGWTMRSGDNGRIQHEAHSLVEDLAKELKK